MEFFSFGKVTMRISDLRTVQLLPSPPTGGPPYYDRGHVEFIDGDTKTVSFEFAKALMDHLKNQTANTEEQADD